MTAPALPRLLAAQCMTHFQKLSRPAKVMPHTLMSHRQVWAHLDVQLGRLMGLEQLVRLSGEGRVQERMITLPGRAFQAPVKVVDKIAFALTEDRELAVGREDNTFVTVYSLADVARALDLDQYDTPENLLNAVRRVYAHYFPGEELESA